MGDPAIASASCVARSPGAVAIAPRTLRFSPTSTLLLLSGTATVAPRYAPGLPIPSPLRGPAILMVLGPPRACNVSPSRRGVPQGGPGGGPGGAPGGPPRGAPRAPAPGPGARGAPGGVRRGFWAYPPETAILGVFGLPQNTKYYGKGGFWGVPQGGHFGGVYPGGGRKCRKNRNSILSRLGELLNTLENVHPPCPGGPP